MKEIERLEEDIRNAWSAEEVRKLDAQIRGIRAKEHAARLTLALVREGEAAIATADQLEHAATKLHSEAEAVAIKKSGRHAALVLSAEAAGLEARAAALRERVPRSQDKIKSTKKGG